MSPSVVDYIKAADVAEIVKQEKANGLKVKLIDVRDSDYDIGGHFALAENVPSTQLLSLGPGLGHLGVALDVYDHIITFCMHSQQRGPVCAWKIHNALPKKHISCVTGGYTALRKAYEGTDLIEGC